MHTFKSDSPKKTQIMVSEIRAMRNFYVEKPLMFKGFDADLRNLTLIAGFLGRVNLLRDISTRT